MKSTAIFFITILLIANSACFGQEDRSEFINQFFPSKMDTGKKYSVWVNMRNTGTTTWSSFNSSDEKNYKLAYIDISNDTVKLYGKSSKMMLSNEVAPGQSAIFKFTITAPSRAGSYISQWRMMHGDEFFGQETKSVIIKVVDLDEDAPKVNNAGFVKQSIPKLMKSKYRSAVTVTLQNNGNTKWTPSKFFLVPVDDKMNFADQNPWGLEKIKLPKEIGPGEKVTFKFQLNVPAQTGTYTLKFSMSEDEQLFGTSTEAVQVSVQN